MPQETPVLENEPLTVQLPASEPEPTDTSIDEEEAPAILDELRIEEVNIDGMCGVY